MTVTQRKTPESWLVRLTGSTGTRWQVTAINHAK